MNHQHAGAILGSQLPNLLTSSPDHPTLDAINLDVCGLNAIPSAVFRLTHIRTLSLYDNRLTVLPNDIGQLSQLTTLNLAANELTAIPDTIGALAHLRMLDLRWNHLSTLTYPAWLEGLERRGCLVYA